MTMPRLMLMILMLPGCAAGAWAQQAVVAFAAASLTDAMNQVVRVYGTKSGAGVKTAYAASSALARQIESGAQADLFFSADEEWMDYLEKRGLVEKATRVSRLGNRLVLVAPAGAARKVALRQGAELLGGLGKDGRLAIGDPASVPAGRYARQALTTLGLWQAIEPRLARADNVRVALSYVERGEAPLGIVYATDAAMIKSVQVVGEFPPESHQAISYSLALIAKRASDPVKAFHAFLLSAEATAIFQKFGFSAR